MLLSSDVVSFEPTFSTTVVVVAAGLGAVTWAVADLVWWTRDDRRRIVRLPRDPGA